MSRLQQDCQPAMPRHCIFCNQPIGKSSPEHVLPKWLLRRMGIGKKPYSGTRFSSATGENSILRKHAAISLVCGDVCGNCNSGWMSVLEQKVEPFLPRMIAGETVALSNANRLDLSRWLTKTAFVANMASGKFQNVPDEHCSALSASPDGMPEGVIVLCGYNPKFVFFEAIHHNCWPKECLADQVPEHLEAILNGSYKSAIQIGHFMALVAHWRSDGFVYLLEEGFQAPLYPTNFAHINRETKCVYEAATVLQWFHRLLAVQAES